PVLKRRQCWSTQPRRLERHDLTSVVEHVRLGARTDRRLRNMSPTTVSIRVTEGLCIRTRWVAKRRKVKILLELRSVRDERRDGELRDRCDEATLLVILEP